MTQRPMEMRTPCQHLPLRRYLRRLQVEALKLGINILEVEGGNHFAQETAFECVSSNRLPSTSLDICARMSHSMPSPPL